MTIVTSPIFATATASALIYIAVYLLTIPSIRLSRCLGLTAVVLLLTSSLPSNIMFAIFLRMFQGGAILKTADILFFRKPPYMNGLSQFCSFRDRMRYTNLLYTELRYPSFDISTQVTGKPVQLKELLSFIALPLLFSPFKYYHIWSFVPAATILVLEDFRLLFYPSSAPLFCSFTETSSCAHFWNHTWHQLFRSPCKSIGMKPLSRFGHSPALCGGFLVMAFYHAYFMSPLLGCQAYSIWTGYYMLQALYITCEHLYIPPGNIRKHLSWTWISISTMSLVVLQDRAVHR